LFRFRGSHDNSSQGSYRFLSIFPVRFFSGAPAEEDETKKEILSSPIKAQNKNNVAVMAVPGIALSAATATAGFSIANIISTVTEVSLSGIPVSILLGMAVKNSVGVNAHAFDKGIKIATKTILQGGIVAVAAKLSFVDLVTSGAQGLPVVVAAVGAGLVVIPQLGRLAGLPTEMSLLLTAGTSICGVTAITALAPAIKATNRDIAVSVANTVALGTIGMLTYPYLLHSLCGASPEQVGLCLGVGIHDTSQVLGAALSYKETYSDDIAFQVAAITKLTRNVALAFAIPGLTYLHATAVKGQNESDEATSLTQQQLSSQKRSSTMSGLVTFSKYVPNFLIAFLGMSAIRSGGDLMLTPADLEFFHQGMNFIGNDLSKYALGTAMAGVGLSTSASALKGVGWRPFAVGAGGALVVGGTGFTVASMVV